MSFDKSIPFIYSILARTDLTPDERGAAEKVLANLEREQAEDKARLASPARREPRPEFVLTDEVIADLESFVNYEEIGGHDDTIQALINHWRATKL